jgi:ADP-heptose:LPS heptosyltransferase
MNVSASALAPRSRFLGRAAVVSRALARRGLRRRPPKDPARVLIAHHLLLGDTLMLTPLLKKLRQQHPRADIVLTVPRPFAPLYTTHPYGVRALGWDPRASPASLFAEGPFDLAIVPGDNRYAWLAAALDSRWIVAFAGDRPATKNLAVDSLVPNPSTPAAWGDLVATLVEGPPPAPFVPSEWRAPAARAFELPDAPYAVLHVGASSPLKRWAPGRWREIASWLEARGIAPVYSAGRGEEALVRECDPQGRYRSFAGAFDLPQLWQLLANAKVLIVPDTGVAHLGRVVDVPTVTLFGPGSAVLCGAGDFWRNARYEAVTIDPFPCRDQRVLFKREIDWVRRCGRSVDQCPAHLCMPAIGVRAVQDAIAKLGVVAP